jgi:ATP-binding cassette subfamily C protein CydC
MNRAKPAHRADLRLVLRAFRRAAGTRLALGVILAWLSALAGIALLGLSGWFITAAGLAGATAGAIAFNVFLPSAGVRLLALGRTASRYGERVVTHDATLAVLAALRERLFRGWARPGAARQLLRRPGRLLFRLTADIDALESLYLRVGVPVLVAVGAALLAGALLGTLDPRLGLAIAVWLTIVGVVVTGMTARRARPLALRRAVALERLRERAIDLVAGQTDLVMAGRLRAQRDAVMAADARLARADRALHRLETRAGGAFTIAGSLTLAATLIAVAALMEQHLIGAPAAALGLLVALAAMEPFAALRRGAIDAGRAALAARRLAPRLGATPASFRPASLSSSSSPAIAGAEGGHRRGDQREKHDKRDELDDHEAPRLRPLPGLAVSLSAVGVVHDGADHPALHALGLRIAEGERVALIGASGAGKSTLMALIAGDLPASTGLVRALPATWMTQRVELFQDSLADNLRLAAPRADDQRLWHALGDAGLADEVRRFARQLDTPLGEGGLGLSGGQARRLSLARLLLRPSPLWLLDEPTEALDADTAADVLRRLRAPATGRTLLIATHLRREAELADRLLVLDAGRLVADLARGTPAFDRALRSLRTDRSPPGPRPAATPAPSPAMRAAPPPSPSPSPRPVPQTAPGIT